MNNTKKKTYQQVLPMDETALIENQFGWIPASIFKPERTEDWREIIKDDGDEQSRRSADAQYLPNLRFSEFHPHLAEIIIRYWSLEGDMVVDPFAGRATRGLVALQLKRKYQGYEVAASTYAKTSAKITPLGGSIECLSGTALAHTLNETADLVFTCPPYHQLERYEQAPYQLSEVATYNEFLMHIKICARNIRRVLKFGKFLCWVCADWRDGDKFRLFHVDSLEIFKSYGLTPHDIVIIHNNSPFVHLQAGKVAANRYTSKTHEYLLVFRKES